MCEYKKIFEADAEKVIGRVDLSSLAHKRILLTGASGLLGVNIMFSIRKYVEKTGAPLELVIIHSKELPFYCSDFHQFSWITDLRGDLTDQAFLQSLPEADIIIHCASYADPRTFMKNKENTLWLNTAALFTLFSKIRENGKLLFMSSSAVYAECSTVPFREDITGNVNPLHPRACYIEGKKCGEVIVNAYREKGVDAKSIRLGITYGPGTRTGDGRALNSFIDSALKTGKISLLDDGAAVKTYLYISDAVEIIWKVLLWGKDPVYNLGGKERIRIAALAEKIGSYMQSSVHLGDPGTGVKGAILEDVLSMDHTEQEFPMDNYICVDEGIRRTVDWTKAVYEADMLSAHKKEL